MSEAKQAVLKILIANLHRGNGISTSEICWELGKEEYGYHFLSLSTVRIHLKALAKRGYAIQNWNHNFRKHLWQAGPMADKWLDEQ